MTNRHPHTIPHRVFCFWFGPPMNQNRLGSLASLERTGAPVTLITEDNLKEWLDPAKPLHAGFSLLSSIHQGDYLRAYFMHHHGGGYSDIKPTVSSWDAAFDCFSDPDLMAVGYQEIGGGGVARLGVERHAGLVQPFNRQWWRYAWLRSNYRKLIGNGAYIMRPGSVFTSEWLSTAESTLDAHLATLRDHPATQPRERPGETYEGSVSQYPITWSALHGDIIQPLAYKHRKRIRRSLPAPEFAGYL